MNKPDLEPVLLHTFKNHLAVIIGFAEAILLDLPEGSLRSDVTEIYNAGTSALALVAQLVDRTE